MLGSQVQLTVRGASDDDADALVDVFRESWLNAYRGILPEFHLDRIIRRRNAEWWRTALRCVDHPGRHGLLPIVDTTVPHELYGGIIGEHS